jgi:hypothetical protein
VDKKTDNRSLPSKIALRRWLLARMQIREVRVLHTCAGLGHVWQAMEEHVTIRQWTRCDVKPRRPGTLALEALDAVKRFPLDVYNVIDIDPFGDPFEIYGALLERLTVPTAVFLTYGHFGPSQLSRDVCARVGLPPAWFDQKLMPRTQELAAFTAGLVLAQTWKRATVQHAARMVHRAGMTVTYYALGLIPHAAGTRTR